MDILFLEQRVITDIDMIWGFLELGHEVRKGETFVPDAEYTEEDVAAIEKDLEIPGLVVTKNFSAATAEACHRKGRVYLSWVHDAPQRSLFMKEAQYDTNIIFMFDRAQVERLSVMNIPHLYHTVLAANVTRASALNITDEEIKYFASDISFIGSMYLYEARTGFLSTLSPSASAEIESVMQEKQGFWDERHTLFKPFTESTMEEMRRHLSPENRELYAFSDDYLFQTLVLCRETAARERVLVLDELSKHHAVNLYTFDPDCAREKLPNVKVHGRADYLTDALKVFFSSKINLNITIPSIETGVPLRVFDIMSVGGFVMSNNQEEAHELFVPDEEIVLFSNIDELKDKVRFYLSHDSKRTRIAIRGYQRVSRDYTVPKLLARMLGQTRDVFGDI